MSDLLLYIGNRRYSSWSLRPYLVLSAAGADFRTEVILLDQPTTKAHIEAVNPAGRVPVLHHGELIVHDSLAIAEYVAELHPDANLWPRDRATRARARAFVAEMHSGFAALRSNMPMDLCASKPGVGHTPEALKDAVRVMQIWRELRAAVPADGGPFLLGAFSIIDAFYAPVAGRFRTYGVTLDHTCQAYVDAIFAYQPMEAWVAAARLEAELVDHK